MKIGIFDSGIGGLSVLHQALRLMDNEEFIYYADKKHVPFGLKTREEIIKYTRDAIFFMVEQGAKGVVVACNTATSAAISVVRQEFDIPIVGMEPAVKKAIDTYGKSKVLVVATPITVTGQKMKGLIERVDKEHMSDLLALPRLVEFAENNEFHDNHVREYLLEQFKGLDLNSYSSLVLGCTHFNYFKDSFRDILPETVKFVDGNEGTIRHLMKELEIEESGSGKNQKISYYYSGVKADSKEELRVIDGYMKRLDMMIDIN